MENPIKMDDLGVPLFLETPIYSRKTLDVYGLCNGLQCSCNWTCQAEDGDVKELQKASYKVGPF